MKTGLVVVNGQLGWLARARAGHHTAALVSCAAEISPPHFFGDAAAFVASAKDEGERERVAEQLRNRVRKCGVCNKPNAFSLSVCNGCCSDLSQIPISFTTNVFAGFVFGLQKGPFPLTASIRLQTKELLVIDDLLSLSRCHLNVIPTTHFIPDFLALLRAPARGLAVLEAMYEAGASVLVEQFLPKRAALFAGDPTAADLRRHVMAGLNYPPSQYQLHLQFISGPLLPFQRVALEKGVHFTAGRFLPIEYVRAVLQCPQQFPLRETSTIEEVFAFFRAHGIDYDAIHRECYRRYVESNDALANWNAADFEGVVVGSEFIPFGPDGTLLSDRATAVENVEALAASDKLVLQNYGRPYDANGKPTGTYYRYPAQGALKEL